MAKGKQYHHGDLRSALIRTALVVAEEEGADAVTLRHVARRAGVSHAAPYHHFADRAALVAAVAEEGFRQLAVAAEQGRSSSQEPRHQLFEAGVAYVVFAVENPEHFRLMFSREVADTSPYPGLQGAARDAKAVMERAVSEGAGERADSIDVVAAWALVHGLATLLIDEQLGPEANAPHVAEDLARKALYLWDHP